MKNTQSRKNYQSSLSRRESLKWLGALSASLMLPSVSAFENLSKSGINFQATKGHWPQLDLTAITVKGYGKDPNLIVPPTSPWPKTLTKKQLTLVAKLSDILIPRDGDVPSASEVHVPDFIDEWVSAPYERQQADRVTVLSCLQWIDDESQLRFKLEFANASAIQQLAIIDDIAYSKEEAAAQYHNAITAFSRFRKLVLAAFFCSPEGIKDIGYLGNVPIAGDYPGPTPEAIEHLTSVLDDLGLSL